MIQQSSAKTKRFLKAINKAAMQKCNDIAKQIDETTKAEMQRAEDEAHRDAHARLATAEAKVIAQAKSEVAKYEKNKKSELCAKRAAYQNELFEQAKRELIDFTKTPPYRTFLADSLAQIAKQASGSVSVQIKVGDMAAKDCAAGAFEHADIIEDAAIEIGGIIVKDSEASLVFDDSLDSRLEQQREWFLSHAQLKVDLF